MAITRLGPNQSVNLASNVTGTLPTANGGTGATSFTAGKILQIKSTANSTLAQVSSNSTTFADVSGQDLLITPTSASSKFNLFVNYNVDTGGDGHGLSSVLTYNHSGISQTYVDDYYDNYAFHITADRANSWQAMNYYLEPNTTNEITFRLQIASSTGGETAYFNRRAYRCIAVEYA
jgi:hypothetical protein